MLSMSFFDVIAFDTQFVCEEILRTSASITVLGQRDLRNRRAAIAPPPALGLVALGDGHNRIIAWAVTLWLVAIMEGQHES